jgi:hypothetical protein
MHGGMGFFSRDEIFSYASKSSSGQGQNAGRPAGLTAGYSALRTVRRLKPMSGWCPLLLVVGRLAVSRIDYILKRQKTPLFRISTSRNKHMHQVN